TEEQHRVGLTMFVKQCRCVIGHREPAQEIATSSSSSSSSCLEEGGPRRRRIYDRLLVAKVQTGQTFISYHKLFSVLG
ncbi:hypothetical protein L9F63_004733, partial [Diploptera punctata]